MVVSLVSNGEKFDCVDVVAVNLGPRYFVPGLASEGLVIVRSVDSACLVVRRRDYEVAIVAPVYSSDLIY